MSRIRHVMRHLTLSGTSDSGTDERDKGTERSKEGIEEISLLSVGCLFEFPSLSFFLPHFRLRWWWWWHRLKTPNRNEKQRDNHTWHERRWQGDTSASSFLLFSLPDITQGVKCVWSLIIGKKENVSLSLSLVSFRLSFIRILSLLLIFLSR